MGKVFVEENDLHDIGDSIREVSKLTNKFYPSQMGSTIRQNLQALDEDTDIDLRVTRAAGSVASRAGTYITDDSIVLGCIADIHYGYYDYAAGYGESVCTTGVENTGQALNRIKKIIGLDACLLLGDVIDGGKTLSKTDAVTQFNTVNNYLNKAFMNVPNYRLNGNHDILRYKGTNKHYDSEIDDYVTDNFSAEELYEHIGKYNKSDDYDDNTSINRKVRNYGYHDFEDRKIRLIYLNTCDSGDIDVKENTEDGFVNFHFSADQLMWFINVINELNDKNDASEWSFITVGHHPLDFGSQVYYDQQYTDNSNNTWDLYGAHILRIIDDYLSGKSVSEQNAWQHDDENIFYDFSNNNARYICHLHGHCHNFSMGNMNIHYTTNDNQSIDKESSVMRVSIPNVTPLRNNQYKGSYAEFSEVDTYVKDTYPPNNTAFNIIIINPSLNIIYFVNYGAAPDNDRILYYGDNFIPVRSLTIKGENSFIYPNETLIVSVDIAPLNATNKIIQWSVSGDTDAVSIEQGVTSSQLRLTGKKPGVITITATSHNDISQTFTLTISKKPIELVNLFVYSSENRDKRVSRTNGILKNENHDADGICATNQISFDWAESHTLYLKSKSVFPSASNDITFAIATFKKESESFAAGTYLGHALQSTIIDTSINGGVEQDGDTTIIHLASGGSRLNWGSFIISCRYIPFGTTIGDFTEEELTALAQQIELYVDTNPNETYEDTASVDSLIAELNSLIPESLQLSEISSDVETIDRTYLDYVDDPEILFDPEWEEHITNINSFFSHIKQDLEDTYIGGDQNVNS